MRPNGCCRGRSPRDAGRARPLPQCARSWSHERRSAQRVRCASRHGRARRARMTRFGRENAPTRGWGPRRGVRQARTYGPRGGRKAARSCSRPTRSRRRSPTRAQPPRARWEAGGCGRWQAWPPCAGRWQQEGWSGSAGHRPPGRARWCGSGRTREPTRRGGPRPRGSAAVVARAGTLAGRRWYTSRKRQQGRKKKACGHRGGYAGSRKEPRGMRPARRRGCRRPARVREPQEPRAAQEQGRRRGRASRWCGRAGWSEPARRTEHRPGHKRTQRTSHAHGTHRAERADGESASSRETAKKHRITSGLGNRRRDGEPATEVCSGQPVNRHSATRV